MHTKTLKQIRAAALSARHYKNNRALAAACTALLRQSHAEHPEGEWIPSGRDAEILDGPLQRKRAARPVSHVAVCRTVTHCAKLYAIDSALTRQYVELIKPHAGLHDVLPFLPKPIAAKLLLDAITV